MLRPIYILALVAALAPGALAQGDADAVRRPERLTAGVSDQLLGQLAPDGQRLYFVSNRNSTNEIYVEELRSGRSHLLFDEGADLTWPRLSPDGKRILYVSYRDDAAGQLCVRDLPDRERRCLGGAGSALQAQWIDSQRIALLSRGSLDADLRVYDVKVGGHLSARPLFDRNLSSPAISPDGRWLVYVPLERYLPGVGAGIAARAAERLEAVRLDRPGAPVTLDADLPGLTGQPAFSPDGRYLYFTQFFNDSNQDGEIDGSDNGVLFRQPFESARDDAPARATLAPPEQLSDASWNCQYPSPSAQLLVATCSQKSGLEIYGLPLDGQVPGHFGPERLRVELELSSREVEQLLLYRRLLERETTPTGQRSVMMRLVKLHLRAGEFVAAQFYAKKIKAIHDPATAGAGTALLALIEHRRALRERERGRLSIEQRDESYQRMESLTLDKIESPAAVLLRRVVRSEIADSLGDKDAARRELEAAPVEQVALPAFLDAYYERADALYRQLDDRDALTEACRRLAQHPSLAPEDRLRYARATARAMARGLPYDEAVTRIAAARSKEPPDSELAFSLELQQAILGVRDENPSKAVREMLVALYSRQVRFDRKRAVVLDAVQRASELEAEKLVEALARLYLDDAPRGTGERLRAERLYERAMLGRAYRRLGRGDVSRAKDAFAELARTAGSLEAHVGYLALSLAEGKLPAELSAEYAKPGAASPPALHLVRAFLAARSLPLSSGKAQADAAELAMDELKKGGAGLRGQLASEVIFGAILHERFLDEGTLAAAQRASVHYLMALELAQKNPRYRARVLGQLALLQSQVGNFRIALGYADDRQKLPDGDPVAALADRLTRARILFHIDRAEDAAKQADEALLLVEKTPALAEWRVLAIDRAALYALAAGRFDRAIALYDRELGAVDAAGDAHNRLVGRLGRAAAALGAGEQRRALSDLDVVDRELADPRVLATLKWPHTTPEVVERGYRLIASGLRANAHLALGELDGAAKALATRQVLAQLRLAQSGLDEHLHAMTLVEARLADVARDRKRPDEAARWLQAALAHADQYVKQTGVPLSADQLDVLRLAAELALSVSPPGVAGVDLPARLRQAFDKLASERDPAFRVQQRWFEIYLALFGPATMARK